MYESDEEDPRSGSVSPISPEDIQSLDRLAYQMENFGSLRWDELKAAVDSCSEDDEYDYYDNDEDDYEEEYYEEEDGNEYSPAVSPKAVHEKRTMTKVENRRISHDIQAQEQEKMKRRIDNRTINHDVQAKEQKKMEKKNQTDCSVAASTTRNEF